MKRRRTIVRRMKGGRFAIGSKERASRQALFAAARHSFQHRRKKKGAFRRLWQVRIGAAARLHGMSYSVFIGSLRRAGIRLDRKMLAALARDEPESFGRLIAAMREHLK